MSKTVHFVNPAQGVKAARVRQAAQSWAARSCARANKAALISACVGDVVSRGRGALRVSRLSVGGR
jgi:hypothetical protein